MQRRSDRARVEIPPDRVKLRRLGDAQVRAEVDLSGAQLDAGPTGRCALGCRLGARRMGDQDVAVAPGEPLRDTAELPFSRVIEPPIAVHGPGDAIAHRKRRAVEVQPQLAPQLQAVGGRFGLAATGLLENERLGGDGDERGPLPPLFGQRCAFGIDRIEAAELDRALLGVGDPHPDLVAVGVGETSGDVEGLGGAGMDRIDRDHVAASAHVDAGDSVTTDLHGERAVDRDRNGPSDQHITEHDIAGLSGDLERKARGDSQRHTVDDAALDLDAERVRVVAYLLAAAKPQPPLFATRSLDRLPIPGHREHGDVGW